MPAFAAHAEVLISPPLYAKATQYQECRIVNISSLPKVVKIIAFKPTGVPATGPYTVTLAPGAAGGISLPASAQSQHCKFYLTDSAKGYRASIDLLDSTVSPPAILTAVAVR